MINKIITIIFTVVFLVGCNKSSNSVTGEITPANQSKTFLVDFPSPGKIVNKNLWIETQSLNTEQLYNKYKGKYNSYGIYLNFDDKHNIISQDNKLYSFFKYNSLLEKDLSLSYANHDKGKIVANAYYKHIFPVVKTDDKLRESFEWFLYKYSNYLTMEPEELLKKFEIYTVLNNLFIKNSSNKKSFIDFVNEINSYYKPHINNTGKINNIAIISGPYGGGHHSAAQAIIQSIKNDAKYNIVKLDECTDFPDTLYMMTRHDVSGKEVGYHACKIYNDVYVNEGNFEKNDLLYILNSKLTEYRPYNRYGDLYKKLKNDNVDFIISTVHHIPQITSFSYMLNIPLRILVTDYEFPQNQWFELNHLNPKLVKYWVPTNEYQGFFRTMVRSNVSNNLWETKIYNTRSEIIRRKIFGDFSTSKFKDIMNELEVFEYLPFPSSESFVPPIDITDSLASRKFLGVSQATDRKIVTLAMGGAPNVSAMLSSIKQFLRISNKIDKKIEVAVLSAGKENVINGINSYLVANGQYVITDKSIDMETDANVIPNKITFKILPRLDYETEMPHVYKGSDVLVSKAGGASTAEIINTSIPFVRAFGLYEWERENNKLLEQLGLSYFNGTKPTTNSEFLAEDLNPYLMAPTDQSILEQVNYFLALPRPVINIDRFKEGLIINYIDNVSNTFDFSK